MDALKFRKSATFIAKRNVSARVERVLVKFQYATGELGLVYCTSGKPTADDLEDCEIMCAELIAEFPEIRKAETLCIPSEEYEFRNNQEEVFSRS